MSEPLSVESAVAGEAAAAAVEEVQSREALQNAAETAVLASEEASIDAGVATAVAADALEASQQASGEAAAAQETAVVVGGMTADALETYRTETDEKLREMREYIDARIPLPAPTPEAAEPDFVEVEADDGTTVSDNRSAGTEAPAGEVDAGTAESGGPGESQKRYGLRHRRAR